MTKNAWRSLLYIALCVKGGLGCLVVSAVEKVPNVGESGHNGGKMQLC